MLGCRMNQCFFAEQLKNNPGLVYYFSYNADDKLALFKIPVSEIDSLKGLKHCPHKSTIPRIDNRKNIPIL
jgi:hypothetical protein